MTSKSDTARLERKVLAGECKEAVLQIAMTVARFPNNATGQRKTFTASEILFLLAKLFGKLELEHR